MTDPYAQAVLDAHPVWPLVEALQEQARRGVLGIEPLVLEVKPTHEEFRDFHGWDLAPAQALIATSFAIMAARQRGDEAAVDRMTRGRTLEP